MKSTATWRKHKFPEEFPQMPQRIKAREEAAKTTAVARQRNLEPLWPDPGNAGNEKQTLGNASECFLCQQRLGKMSHAYHGEQICGKCHDILEPDDEKQVNKGASNPRDDRRFVGVGGVINIAEGSTLDRLNACAPEGGWYR